MTIVYLCPVAFAATGLFHSSTVSEFGTVVDSDRPKDFAEICAVFTFKTIQDTDHTSGGLVAHRTNDFTSGLSFGQNQKGFLCFLFAFDTVHFPVTNDSAIVDFLRAVFDSGSSRTVYGEVTETYSGAIVLTNRRIVFIHNQAGFECKISALTAVTPVDGSVVVQAGSKTYQFSVARQDLFVSALSMVTGK